MGRLEASVTALTPRPRRIPAEVQRKTSRPERANPLPQFAHPGCPVQEKEPPC